MSFLPRPSGRLIGRATEVRSIRKAITRSRVVTLVGPGGVGKTALASEIMDELEPEFRSVAVAPLANATDGHGVHRVVGEALGDGTADEATLSAMLDDGTLLVLDNCEHVVDDVARLVDALSTRNRAGHILATSRRPLGLVDEVIWTVAPLPVADVDDGREALLARPAIQLFLERVRRSVPGFELTSDNAGPVGELCRAADGVPLLIELAAALVRTRPLDEIVHAMRVSPAHLTASRRDGVVHQRSLVASLEWSHSFLDDRDRRLLGRLSVFVGGFRSDAARAVDPDGEPDGLPRLVDHSLVTFDPQSGRYGMLEVVRLDALQRLDDDERREAYAAHLGWCLGLVTDIEATRFDADPDNRFPLFDLDLPNLCAAILRCEANDDRDNFRALLGPIALWWVHHQPPDDPDRWSTMFEDEQIPIAWRANVQSALAYFWSHRGDHERSIDMATAAIELHAAAGDTIGQSLAQLAVGNALAVLGDVSGAIAAFQAALATGVASGHPYPELVARVNLARVQPNNPASKAHLTDALPTARRGFGALAAVISSELAVIALHEGRLSDAIRLGDEAVDWAARFAYPEARATALCSQAEVRLATGNPTDARVAYSEAHRLGKRIAHTGILERAQRGLDNCDSGDHAPERSGVHVEPLSDRELAVARLLRGDLTQAEIASELYIAPSTVKTHIKSIYRKLGVSKRSHAVTRSIELGLFS